MVGKTAYQPGIVHQFHRLQAGTLIALAFALSLPPPAAAANISAIWANDGMDKVTQDELRAAAKSPSTQNRVWDGVKISIFGGRNEVVSFNVVLEAAKATATGITVSLHSLTGPGGATITSIPAAGNGVFSWTGRPIEVFYVRYLQIKGLSTFCYETYDERHVPVRMRRPFTGEGMGTGGWTDRPDHDKYYPDIAVPIELVPTFTIASGHNQSVWVDIYIPKLAAPGLYKGTLAVQEAGSAVVNIPVELKVYNFTLPDKPTAKTMLYFSSSNINRRFTGADSVTIGSAADSKVQQIRNRLFMLAHRHRISLIGDATDDCKQGDQPCPEWLTRLDGSLFSTANGYDGPGVGEGNNVYSIGTFGNWTWKAGTETDMRTHTDAWQSWFEANAADTEHFLYLCDESTNYGQTEMWAGWMLNNPGPGQRLKSMATLPLPDAVTSVPSLDIPTSSLATGVTNLWQAPADRYSGDARKRFFVYNGHRPGTGSYATEDDGVALRALAWAGYKKHINRWFYWESTYYNNYQGAGGQVDVFQTAHTFGNSTTVDPVKGQTGYNYSNGEGVLFYPGTDALYPGSSYNVDGMFASLRLKDWRRGLQDAEYLEMASKTAPNTVMTQVNNLVPKVLWEYGVTDPNDPTYVRTDISWPVDPEKWEAARAQLVGVLSGAIADAPGAGGTGNFVVYPNPWRKDKHAGSPMTFANLPPGTTIKIFTVSAHLVTTLTVGVSNSAAWDLTTSGGDNAASGLYLYLVTPPDGNKLRGKIALIR